jgi:dihydroorotase
LTGAALHADDRTIEDANGDDMANLLLRGGRVIDTVSGHWQTRDLQVIEGRIAPSDAPPAADATVIDVSDAWVAPGFVDLHAHVFSHDLYAAGALTADRIGINQGVACVVDAGSFGASMADGFHAHVMATQHTRVFAFINIGSAGVPHLPGGHSSRPEYCDLPGVVRAIERHGDWLVGVKILASQSHTGSFGLDALKLARKAAELTGRPLMVHLGNPPPIIEDVLELMRPGDIATHAYHGKHGGVLGFQDRVIDAFRAAVARGVIVDIGHGQASFSFRVCEQALAQGMPIHCISTDLHRGSLKRPAISLARTMSKLRAVGLSLMDVVRAVTLTPARAIDIERHGFGVLAPGQPARITVFREHDEPWELEDAEGGRRVAPGRIETLGVVLGDRWHLRSEAL